jgi:hypothetical protein
VFFLWWGGYIYWCWWVIFRVGVFVYWFSRYVIWFVFNYVRFSWVVWVCVKWLEEGDGREGCGTHNRGGGILGERRV